jgi:hypothetical protein
MKISSLHQPATRLLNLLLWLGSCFVAATGLLMEYRLPPGREGGAGLSLLGLGRHDWGELHLWAGWVVIVLVVLHLALHWRWLAKAAAKGRKWPVAAGLAAGAALIVLAFVLPVQSHRSGPAGHAEHSEK